MELSTKSKTKQIIEEQVEEQIEEQIKHVIDSDLDCIKEWVKFMINFPRIISLIDTFLEDQLKDLSFDKRKSTIDNVKIFLSNGIRNINANKPSEIEKYLSVDHVALEANSCIGHSDNLRRMQFKKQHWFSPEIMQKIRWIILDLGIPFNAKRTAALERANILPKWTSEALNIMGNINPQITRLLEGI